MAPCLSGEPRKICSGSYLSCATISVSFLSKHAGTAILAPPSRRHCLGATLLATPFWCKHPGVTSFGATVLASPLMHYLSCTTIPAPPSRRYHPGTTFLAPPSQRHHPGATILALPFWRRHRDTIFLAPISWRHHPGATVLAPPFWRCLCGATILDGRARMVASEWRQLHAPVGVRALV